MSQGPAFYARGGGLLGDLLTLLHPPYTLWHLSHVAIGASLAPQLEWVTLGGTLLAFFFGLGVGAHAFDEVKGRPLRTSLGDGALWALGVGGMLAAAAVAVVGMAVISPWVLAWAAAGILIATGYALEWSKLLHSDWGFAVSWGAFPVLVGYWAQTQQMSAAALLLAAAATVIARGQRALSTSARRLRRRPDTWPSVPSALAPELLTTWEGPLRLLSWAMPLLAAGLLARHL